MTNSKQTKKTIAMKKQIEKKQPIKTIAEVQEEKHIQEEKNQEKPVENGTGIVIILSGDLLLGGLLYKRQIPYKVDKPTFLTLQKHCEVLGIAIRLG